MERLMKRGFGLVVGLMVVVMGMGGWGVEKAEGGPVLPGRDGSYNFFYSYGLGFSDGDLYVHTGNSIYRYDGGNVFTKVAGNLESAFGGGTRSYAGTFATAPGKKAFVSMGYPDAGAMVVDLTNGTTQVVGDFDDANIFSAAGRPNGNFLAMYTDALFTVTTRLYTVNVTGATTAVVDVGPGPTVASGGVAVDGAGNVVAGTFDWLEQKAYFYRILKGDLESFENGGPVPGVEILGSGSANGNGAMVVDGGGNVFFSTTTGIGKLAAGSGSVVNWVGDIQDGNLFGYGNNPPMQGLAYQMGGNEIWYAKQVSGGQYELTSFAIPEPASMVGLGLVGVMVLAGRGRRK